MPGGKPRVQVRITAVLAAGSQGYRHVRVVQWLQKGLSCSAALQLGPGWGRDSHGRVAIAPCCYRLESVKFCCFAMILTLLKMKSSKR